MGSVLQKFGAIESRVTSYSCPHGTTGRIHAIRLRRRFGSTSYQGQPIIAGKEKPSSLGAERVNQTNIILQTHHDPARNRNRPVTRKQLEEVSAEDASPQRQNYDPEGLLEELIAFESPRRNKKEVDYDRNDDFESQSLPETSQSHQDKALYSALRQGDPHAVLKTLHNLIRHNGTHTAQLVSNMPRNAFSELLRSIDPQTALGKWQAMLDEVSPRAVRRLGLPPLDRNGYHRLCTEFMSQINVIIQMRQEESPLCLSDFKYLLKCARVLGNPRLAEEVWNSMDWAPAGRKKNAMKVVPDAECYSHYLAAKCHNDVTNPLLRYRLRIVPDNLLPRIWKTPPYSLSGHHIGPGLGIKAQISNVFHKMAQSGMAGSEENFCWMIIALGREGEIVGVASILKRVWDIDVQALLASSNDLDILPTKVYPFDSPLCPSSQLLYTIAHVYGINNDIPTALRLVDFVSRQYGISIPNSAWSELLQWTFVLSQESSGARLDRRTSRGQLPAEAVSNLWATMTGEPYRVRPTMAMYNRLIMNLLARQRYGEVQQRMIEAQRLLSDTVRRLSHRTMVLKAALRRSKLSSTVLRRKARDICYWLLRVKISRQYIQRWVRLTIHHGSKSLRHNPSWSSQGLPNFVEKWELFLPSKVRYRVRAGTVSFPSGVVAEIVRRKRLRESKGPKHRMKGMMDWVMRRVELRRARRNLERESQD